MRKILVTAALTAGVALTLLPAAPASAYCDPLTSSLIGRCTNPCYLVAGAYEAAEDRVRLLPDLEFICFA